MAYSYPPSRRSDAADVLHGVRVPDPYRWLEDAGSSETRGWVDAQNAFTRSMLDGARRDALVSELTRAYDVPRAGAPLRRGRRVFLQRNSGLQPQPVLYVLDDAGGEPRVLLDPNTLSEDGTTALTGAFPSDDGALVAYAISAHGSDRQVMRVRDVATGVDRPDVIEWVKFASVAWLRDGSGFFYLRFPAPGEVAPEDEQYFGRIHLHRLGAAQREDPLIFSRPDEKEVVPLVDLTEDGDWLVVTCQRGASDDAEIYLVNTRREEPPRAVFTGYDAAYAFTGSRGSDLFFRTTRDAPMGRVIAWNRDTGVEREVVAEAPDRLSAATLTARFVAAVYLHDASDRLRLLDAGGHTAHEVSLPEIGTVVSFDARQDADEIVFAFTSFTSPSRVYRWSPEMVVPRPIGEIAAAGSAKYSTTQVWCTSKDGTRVPIFLVHRPDVSYDGNRPVVLSGYGGFNISRTPQFDPGNLPFLDRGGVFAVANLRGGGEFGEAWHRAGMLDRKQNVFDDFIAAAEWLVANSVTSPRRLAIEGGSNGGLLVGAVMVQRPDLFGAVVCRVPVADMLRYHLFTVGRFWIPEYGSADDPAQFRYLLAYSPYHNVRDGVAYPPTLVMTADTDDRVSPGMAKKFAARLQAAGGGGPILIRVETKAGHGAGKPVQKVIEEDADILTFLAASLKLEV